MFLAQREPAAGPNPVLECGRGFCNRNREEDNKRQLWRVTEGRKHFGSENRPWWCRRNKRAAAEHRRDAAAASPSQRWPGAAAHGAGPGGQPGGLCLPPSSQAVPSRAVYSVVRPPFCNRESVLVNVGDRNVITESLMKLNHFASKRTGRGSVSLAAGMAERILKADW